MYRVTIDKAACDGIFACLVRDERFEESAEGLATVDADTAQRLRETGGEVVADFDDDRIERAREAAAACPPGAITVDEVDSLDGTEGREAEDGTEEVSEPCP